mmetsp:Transcript_24915/g.69784  ORF Transcript_24915/g.69784 Transcript_24915/m.69784 type:complete len:203 (-) Transcript_24915:619-1227(-)
MVVLASEAGFTSQNDTSKSHRPSVPFSTAPSSPVYRPQEVSPLSPSTGVSISLASAARAAAGEGRSPQNEIWTGSTRSCSSSTTVSTPPPAGKLAASCRPAMLSARDWPGHTRSLSTYCCRTKMHTGSATVKLRPVVKRRYSRMGTSRPRGRTNSTRPPPSRRSGRLASTVTLPRARASRDVVSNTTATLPSASTTFRVPQR